MSAIAALLNVTAERGGAATLDRRHGMPLRRRQRRPRCSRKAGPKQRNTSATSSPSRATKPRLGGYQVRTVGKTTLRTSADWR